MTTKKICVIDGGGAKGVTPFTVIKNIEKTLGKNFSDIFDLAVGSSIGGIIPGVLTMTDWSAEDLLPEFKKTLYNIFKPRMRLPIVQAKYSREKVERYLNKYLKGKTLGDARTKYMLSSVNMVTGRTHFFKSWEEKDGGLSAVDVINRTYAAPLYFGSVVDGKNKAVWLDGGTSNNSAPLVESYVEVLKQGWTGDTKVHILSLGCGQRSHEIPFKKAKKYNNLKQVLYYMNPLGGGAARVVAADSQTEWLKSLDEVTENFTFQRIELNNMEPKIDVMDGRKYLDEYESIGEKLSRDVDYKYLE